ncbi:MAG: hypothetical protein HOL04_04770 [Gammaproteobacteria bacterium]|jgi:hypothetical protein|nr:hypothetical protein [Gammaproteobacteria bacterium]MBT4608351.1 hypothetical protein [Thiotrichales bacterium]MBT3473661.1 hypothetical protein [Gammaproteobacteria bacterium]MBT3967916.1 hypothetical protein [Gammaproteobacteria bacterium]MBT4079286.1 hypothetical protein [Gammaproteobacteria bacterium]
MPLQVFNDETGAAVDWWFIYKLPKNATQPKEHFKNQSGEGKVVVMSISTWMRTPVDRLPSQAIY